MDVRRGPNPTTIGYTRAWVKSPEWVVIVRLLFLKLHSGPDSKDLRALQVAVVALFPRANESCQLGLDFRAAQALRPIQARHMPGHDVKVSWGGQDADFGSSILLWPFWPCVRRRPVSFCPPSVFPWPPSQPSPA